VNVEAAVPCPPTLIDPTVPDPDTHDGAPALTVDVAVVGAGAAGAATAWHLARHGLRVVLLERRGAAEVWRSAGTATWTDAGLPAALAAAAATLWRQVEDATGAALLHVDGGARHVRADQATAALTAAATAWGTLLRHCDPVLEVTVTGSAAARHGAHVGTRSIAVHAEEVVLVGAGPAALAPHGAAVRAVDGTGSFAVPALTA
jgi:choline dehydrogenase-like flavoprotein